MKKPEYKPRQVRLFSIILFSLIGFFTYRATVSRGISITIIAFAAEAAVLLIIMLKPRWFFPIFKIAIILSSFLGNIIFTVISALVFFFILTPIALVMRLFGKKFLVLGRDNDRETYFEEYVPHAGVEKQF